ncbi:D-alanine--D-alanine ligase [Nitrosospira multiformis]|uniref:D-alanine--D-alanine ligase n=1 Tax=Nitrosospira multiformis TaxID=1231 RepID=A0A1I7IBX7_9PROT|nr:D-alanine--D-alanine ligase [Nitrosospira multiformis]SFU70434.1 D-alanine--D-alanine ligase [Nitrosospira multiformis]
MAGRHDFGKVAVLLGGRSAEREISLESGKAVLDALRRCGVDAHPFDPSEQHMDALLHQGYARAHIALHGRYGEDGTVQGALELLGLPYTGSGLLASALAMDKWRTKLLWQSAGINTPRHILLDEQSDFDAVAKELGLPLIVKPSREGSTIGLSKVRKAGEVAAAWRLAARHDAMVLAEQFIEGTELTASILGDVALPLVRIQVEGDLYDYEAKYLSDKTQYFCPSGVSEEQECVIRKQALQAYRLLGCEGWGRVDLILDRSGTPYFLEANTSPGMTTHSLVPMAAKTAGISFEELVLKILELAHVG